MGRRLVAVGVSRRGSRLHVWRTEAGWFRAVSLAHPDAAEGPFATRAEAEASGRVPMVVATSQQAEA